MVQLNGEYTGITPAWAGKRFSVCWFCWPFWDHPRVGGEKIPTACQAAHVQGSPPRGRGKVLQLLHGHSQVGITPAWAGKSDKDFLRLLCGQDHPRVGGEKTPGDETETDDEGSPPRGRGKDERHFLELVTGGITPAWAGKSGYKPAPDRRNGDHPRVGGEKFFHLNKLRGDRGSPPRGRGKDIRLGAGKALGGITPAWAGKSSRRTQECPRI